MNLYNLFAFWLEFSRYFLPIFGLFNFILFQPWFKNKVGRIRPYMMIALYLMAIISSFTLIFEQRISSEVEKRWKENVSQKLEGINNNMVSKNDQDKNTDDVFSCLKNNLLNIAFELKGIKQKLKADNHNVDDFIIDYFTKTSKIPNRFNENQWKETESLIYKSFSKQIENIIFNGHAGPRSGDRINEYYNEFKQTFDKERKKFVETKWKKKK
ncbi:MAG: hypothetical protein FD145_683 [Candidatus Saganbacteria bacterium]|uniref:Uncharacterized protein n=1 Tax=Candidatus Saganbacteria bacterium TaxID=2575572 RepID=A0A833NX84_UNCSA|nr:MAG: hypothetical protein FD145_683 [Candidatus Saganbacteria bacterium]